MPECNAINRGQHKSVHSQIQRPFQEKKLELEICSLKQSVYQACLFRVSSGERKRKCRYKEAGILQTAKNTAVVNDQLTPFRLNLMLTRDFIPGLIDASLASFHYIVSSILRNGPEMPGRPHASHDQPQKHTKHASNLRKHVIELHLFAFERLIGPTIREPHDRKTISQTGGIDSSSRAPTPPLLHAS